MSNSIIELSGVNKVYRVGEEDFFVLKHITFNIIQGELVGLIGASGSGKSTLMHLIGLLDRSSSGRILIDDRDVSLLNDDELSRLRNSFVGFVFQQFNLINKLTVRENILLPSVYRRAISGNEYEERADKLLHRFGMWERRNFYPNKISGGQQQRTAIIRALIMHPKLILADEPTGNLDSKTGEEILKLLKLLNKDFGVTVVIVTHDEHVAMQTTRLIRLVDGEIKR